MVFEIGGEFMYKDINSVICYLYTTLIQARKFRTSEYSSDELTRTALLHRCYGMVETLFLLDLISRDRYVLLNKAVDTLDISIIEEFIYKLSKQRSTK